MKPPSLLFPFLLALFALFFSTIFFSTLRLIAFAPFFAILFVRKPYLFSLWTACLCGLLVDLCNTDIRFGLFSLGYLLTTVFAHRIKSRFFETSPLSICVYTSIISALFSVIQCILMPLFHETLSLSMRVLITSCILMPLVDALYALIWFICPMWAYQFFIRKKEKRTLFQ